MISFTLNNGVIINTSRRTKTGYEGCMFGPKYFKNHGNRVFGANVSKPNHPLLVAANKTPGRQGCLELGSYADPREAAYVHSLWNLSTTAEQLEILVAVQNGMFTPSFPGDLYDLPTQVNFDMSVYDRMYSEEEVEGSKRTVTVKAKRITKSSQANVVV